MPSTFKYRILIVDDQEKLLQTTAEVLTHEGYLVETAHDGFEALAVLRGGQPEILISDLNMPNMSGFELLAVVRKRFPGVGVIVYSGDFLPQGSEDVLADRFLAKGANSTFELLEHVRELLEQRPLRAQQAKSDNAPAWLPRSTAGYIVVTCTVCLRSFSVLAGNIEFRVVQNDKCLHCGADISYRLDGTLTAEVPSYQEQMRTRIETSRQMIEQSQEIISTSTKKTKK